MYIFGIYCFLKFYVIPCMIICTMYGLVILKLRKRKSHSDLGSSEIINNASDQLTKTAIIVSALFVVLIGYDSWYFVLGHARVVPYVVNSPIQNIGVFLSVLNSCCNPAVYTAFMPMYRRSVMMTLKCVKKPVSTTSSNIPSTVTEMSTITG